MINNDNDNKMISKDLSQLLTTLAKIEVKLEMIVKRLDEKVDDQNKRLTGLSARIDKLEQAHDISEGRNKVLTFVISAITSLSIAVFIKYIAKGG